VRTRNFEACGEAESTRALTFVFHMALRPDQIEFSHSLGHERTLATGSEIWVVPP
jgi:hypothetical protein